MIAGVVEEIGRTSLTGGVLLLASIVGLVLRGGLLLLFSLAEVGSETFAG